MKICGFMLVRRPTNNFDPTGRGIWPKRVPKVGNACYGGVWRMPWYDLDVSNSDNTLPEEIRDLYSRTVTDLQGSGFRLCESFEYSNIFLNYCNRNEYKCELIAVNSTILSSMKGVFDEENIHLKHLGWEPFQIGGGSLLLDGIFAAPQQFKKVNQIINNCGLIDTTTECLQYISEYHRLVKKGALEEIFPEEVCPIEPIEILSVSAHFSPEAD